MASGRQVDRESMIVGIDVARTFITSNQQYSSCAHSVMYVGGWVNFGPLDTGAIQFDVLPNIHDQKVTAS